MQETVEAASVPSRTVEVEAAELASYIASLPRLLTENLTINVSGGTAPEMVNIPNFYGPGSLKIIGPGSDILTFSQGINIERCSIPIFLQNLFVKRQSAGNNNSVIKASENVYVGITNCKVEGLGSSITDRGVNAVATPVELSNIKIYACYIGVFASVGGIVAIASSPAGNFDNNTTGIYAYAGGLVMLRGSAPSTLGGSSNIKSGGLIVNSNGTLL